METTGIIQGFKKNERKTQITFLIDSQQLEIIEELKSKKLNIEFKKYYEKRTTDANAYCWKLCDLIAKELSNETIITKEDVYKDAINQIGTFTPMIWPEDNFENCKRIWENQGLGFLVKEDTRRNKVVKVFCYYGSSTYNKKEMWLLIQLIIELAHSLNIETKSPAEVKSMIESWDIK